MKKIKILLVVGLILFVVFQLILLIQPTSSIVRAEENTSTPIIPAYINAVKVFLPWAGFFNSPVTPTKTPTPTATKTATPTPTATYTPTPTQPPSGSKYMFGVENWFFGDDSNMNNEIVPLNPLWLRRNGLKWGEIESSEGARNWPSSLENEFVYASQKGKNIVLIIRYTPSWARQYSGSHCGPIKDTKINSFANFMKDVVARYSKPPYNVMYYEIWNEPDAPVMNNPEVNFGCWGSSAGEFNWDPNDPYFNGKYFSKVLKAVYPKMKEANQNAKVIIGGLLMECDPINPPDGRDCRMAKYLEGILVDGGKNYFDAVGFHAYDYYYPKQGLGAYGNTGWNADRTTGPSLIAKANYLRSVLNNYGAGNKQLMVTEISLLCGNDDLCGDSDTTFQTTKAFFLIEAYAASIERGLDAAIWYTMYNSWRHNGLCANGSCQTDKYEAYDAMKFITQELGTTTGGSYVSNNDFHIYKINTVNKGVVWVMWSKDGSNHSYTFSTTPSKVYNWKGNSISPSKTMTIGTSPIYVEGVP